MIDSFIAFLFGLLIGSFLNVCIYRWPRDLSVVRPRSHCTSCETPISAFDNVPLLSFLLLRGRCRKCGGRISWRYPAVELGTGLLFFYFVQAFGVTAMAVKLCCLSAMLLALVFTDLEQRILPDELTVGGMVLGLIFALFVQVPDITAAAVSWMIGLELSGRWASLAESVAGAVLPALFLWGGGWLYYKVRRREGLGFGDVKLVAMVGSFLGMRGALITLIIGSVAGSILGYSYIKVTRQDSQTYELPFGTFLGAAAILAAIGSRTWQ
ncbi:MAG TPA: prepilin peptidase [Candidatus Acidoferrales bacterium]|nr:prepilin peptidase [Candidatus Acidoferrales bacterium]